MDAERGDVRLVDHQPDAGEADDRARRRAPRGSAPAGCRCSSCSKAYAGHGVLKLSRSISCTAATSSRRIGSTTTRAVRAIVTRPSLSARDAARRAKVDRLERAQVVAGRVRRERRRARRAMARRRVGPDARPAARTPRPARPAPTTGAAPSRARSSSRSTMTRRVRAARRAGRPRARRPARPPRPRSGSASSHAAQARRRRRSADRRPKREPLGQGHRHPQPGERARAGPDRHARSRRRSVATAPASRSSRRGSSSADCRWADGPCRPRRPASPSGVGERERQVGRGGVDGDDHGAGSASARQARRAPRPWAVQRSVAAHRVVAHGARAGSRGDRRAASRRADRPTR